MILTTASCLLYRGIVQYANAVSLLRWTLDEFHLGQSHAPTSSEKISRAASGTHYRQSWHRGTFRALLLIAAPSYSRQRSPATITLQWTSTAPASSRTLPHPSTVSPSRTPPALLLAANPSASPLAVRMVISRSGIPRMEHGYARSHSEAAGKEGCKGCAGSRNQTRSTRSMGMVTVLMGLTAERGLS